MPWVATGLKVSRLGLGHDDLGPRHRRARGARPARSPSSDAGGTLLDTAPSYGDGASEELIGTLLGDVVARDDVVLATKAGISRRRGERVTDTSRGYLLTTLDPSLQRLRVDHVDLWQVHVWSDDTPIEETLSALDPAVTTGRASYVGISNYSGWQTAQAATWQRAVPGRARWPRPRWSTPCSTGASSTRCSPAAEALGLGVLPWSPLGRGVLTGKYRTGTPADSRGASPHFAIRRTPTSTTARRAVVEAVVRAAEGLGWSPLEVALAWVRDRPGRHRADRRCPHRRPARRRSAIEDLTLPTEIVGGARRRVRHEGNPDACPLPAPTRPPPRCGVGVRQGDLSREFPRNVVTKLLVERAEHGGWELDRVRIGPDGTRRVDPAPQDHPRGPRPSIF